MKHLRRLLLLILPLLCISCMALSQTSIFSETFDEADGATSGVSAEGIAWMSTCPDCVPPMDILAVDNGTMTADDTNGPATWITDPIDISNCSSISVTMDYAGDPYPATGSNALESSFENCPGSTGPCPGDPDDPYHPNCECWDFAEFNIIIDGVTTNIELIGTSYIPTTALIEFLPTCVDNAEAVLEVTMKTSGSDEEMMLDNVVMLCWMEPVAEALAVEICEGESVNLDETSSDGVSWSWTGPSGSSSNNAWNINNATIAESGTYTVVVTDPNACSSSDAIDITVYEEPEANWVDSDLMQDVCNGGCIEIELDLIGEAPFEITFAGAVLGLPNTETLTFNAGETTLTACLDYNGSLFDPVDWDDADNSVHVWPGVTSVTTMGTLTILNVVDANGCENTDDSPMYSFTIIEEVMPMFDDLGPYCNTENLNVSFPNISNNGVNGTWSPSNTFNPSTLGPGMHDFTFTPDAGECAIDETVTIIVDDCSCELTSAIASNIVCNADGTLTYDLIVEGTNVGTWWTSSDGVTSGNYGVPITINTNVVSGIADLMLTISDLDDPSCTIEVSVPVPAECYCDIEFSGFTFSSLDCHDNNTPNDPTDDYIIFEINPTGVGLGGSYTISPITTIPPGGTYGTSQIFQTQPGTAGNGGQLITLNDDSYSLCVLEFWLPDPGTCSDACSITATASIPLCDDNGTPSDPSDDTFSFDINVTGVNTASGWTANDPLGTTGIYGVDESFTGFPISGGDVTITITDDTDPLCTTMITIMAPTTCSSACDITAIPTLAICDDNGTPSDPSDDTFSFDLNVTGVMTGSGWTANDPLGTTGTYGVDETFSGFPISGGNVILTIVDDTDLTCTDIISVAPPLTCSDACDISVTASIPLCDDNGTPSDPSDDTFSFDLNVTGLNTGLGWTANDPLGTTGFYGVDESFSGFPIAGGDVTITITDDADPSCTFMITIMAPSTCSSACDITAIPTLAICDDNGTPSDPSDDTFSFDLNVTGVMTGSGWTANDPLGTTGTYGVDETFSGFPISGGNVILTIVDDTDLTCTDIISVTPPLTCSDACDISVTASIPLCDDNGTPSDPSDDTFSFDLNVTGLNTGLGWTANDPLGTTGSYGVDESFIGFPIAGGDVTITITDDADPSCTSMITIMAPATCSNTCDISVSATTPMCDNNGTPSDPSDDTFFFDLNVTGVNTAISWTANDPLNTTGNYGVDETFSGFPISGGDVTITITDNNDPSCTTMITITAPVACSDACDISATATIPICDDNGTPSDPSDDTFSFDLNVTGVNTASTWTANDPLNTTGAYAMNESFSGFPISAGAVSITVTDDNDPLCTTTISVDPPVACSDACDIVVVVSNITCNNAGSPSDDTDDLFFFDVLVTGANTGMSWTANDVNNSNGFYGQVTTLGPYDIANGALNFTITDSEDNTCTAMVMVTEPSTCSTTCSISNMIVDLECNNFGTPSDPSDDTYTVELIVSGLNLGPSWTADDPLLSSGLYGVNEVLGPYDISTGPFMFTIADMDNPACVTIVNVNPPPTCSDLCDIDAIVDNIVCNNGGTPSDPSDDSFTFDVTVTGLNTGASWGATDPGMTTGSYGIPQAFGPYPISGGDVNFTISDNLDGACQTSVMVVAPSTCSDVCDITATVGLTTCQDNNSPSDPSDDTFSFEVVVTGANTGSMWTSDDPSGLTGNYGTPVIFGPYDISNGAVTINLFDAVDGLCTTVIMVAPPSTCSDLCDIEYLASVPVCNDNNTPSDPSDDTYSFELTINGANTGASWTSTDPLMLNGAYGTVTLFGPYPISGGDLTFTITDSVDPLCQTTVNIEAPMTCSDLCVIDYTVTNIVCNNNNTPSDDTDDTFSFDIEVTGSNTGAAWTANDPNATTGTYGVLTAMGPYPIANGTISFTLTDNASNTCTANVMVTEPATCSTTCSISNTITNINCDNNNTPSDPSDDLFTVEVIVSGLNLGSGWSANDPLMTTGLYGVTTILGPYAISNGPFTIVITDDADDMCTTEIMLVPPMSCSDLCNIEAIVDNVICLDNDTPSDPSDDLYTFDIFVDGMNIGSSWSANDPNSSSGSYGVSTNFGPFDIANGAVSFTIIDGVDPTCSFFVNVPVPTTCSDVCDLETVVTNIICDDNNTPSDPSDDTFSFDVNVTGANVATTWTANDPNATMGSYNTTTSFGPYLISGGALNFDIIDGVDGVCLENLNISPPMTCSDLCDIDIVVSNILCSDNNTPSDASDDIFTFDVVVSGSNNAASWTASDPNNTGGAYDAVVSFGPYLISGGDISFTVTDGIDPACTELINVEAPATCSDACALDFVVTNILCDANGTPSDDSDDLYTFDVVVSGFNTSASWNASDANNTTGSYNTIVNFGPFLISNGNQSFTISDANNPNCNINVTVLVPNTCSTTCSITNLVDNVTCDDNGTPSDPSDDLYFFDLIITGSNIGTSWSADDPLASTGLYGVTVPMGPYLISNGILNFTVTDDTADPSCTTTVSVTPPMSCSDLCAIEAIVSNVTCDNNNTPSDPNDDTYSFDLEVNGMNIGTTWTANDPNAVSGSYATITNFGPYPISGGDLNFIITDGNASSCSFAVNVVAPNTCSEECAIETIASNIICSDGGTPSDPSDDTFSFDVLVTGSNNASSWTADDPNNATGTYGVTTSLGPYPISGGDLNFTITDFADPQCISVMSVEAPVTCSDLCDISAEVSNIICQDNATPSDPSDDVFTFDVFVTGFNTATNWTATDPNGTSGSYGAFVTFGPYPISGGDITFTITDGVSNVCVESVTVAAPLSCSNLCSIDYIVNNVLCNDNGTPSDDSDDTYSFDIVVSGLNTGISWSANDPNSSFGNYDQTYNLGPYPISNGNQNFVITDDADPTCTVTVLVQAPTACSVSCSISNSVTNVTCDDNGTPTNPDDDIFFFDLIMTGSNTGTSWSANDPNLSGGLYDVTVQMGPYNISDGILNFTVTDNANSDCTSIISVTPPATCSELCALQVMVFDMSCDDNGTASDPSDDLFSFTVIVDGENSGTSWIADDPNATSGSYGTSIVFGPYMIIDGDLSFEIMDGLDLNCAFLVEVEAPFPCSEACDIEAELVQVSCNDNGTPSNPSDDSFSFDVLVEGVNGTTNWTATDPNTTTGVFGVITSFGPYPISGGDIAFEIVDDGFGMCSELLTVIAPPTCSDLCVLEVELNNVTCNDNNTPSDSSDDLFSFDVIVSGANIGTSWQSSDPNATNGSYDILTSFGPYPISGGDLNFVITDLADPACMLSVNVAAPASCSDACEIEYVLSNVLCDNNNTPSDDSDDSYTFDILVTGTNSSASWIANDPNATTGAFGALTSFGPYAIADGNQNFLISDATNMSCAVTAVVIAPDACSTSCSLTNIVSNVSCNDNGTPSDGSDDLYYFDLEITGSNLGSAWSANDPAMSSGSYNTLTNLGPYAIVDGILNFVVTDDSDPDCNTTVSVTPPSACSELCTIELSIIDYNCNDNGTPFDAADDLFTAEIQVTGTNQGSSWTADDPNNSSGSYNSPITIGPYLISDGNINITITDGIDPMCTAMGELIAPPSCSDACSISYMSSNVVCNDNGTPTDSSDDSFTFDLVVTGTNVTGTTWTATDINATIGSYGVVTNFGPFLISDGAVMFTVMAGDDPDCFVEVNIAAPMDCSDDCTITTVTQDVICDDNGTPSDPSDDNFSFTLLVNGTNSSMSWSADDLNSTAGQYGVPELFGPYPISLGAFNFNIVDDQDPMCTINLSVNSPSDCSETCALELALADILCDNLGTEDPSDDTFTFNVTVTGINTGSAWNVDDGNVTTGAYGSTVSFGPYLIANGDINLNFSDADDSACIAGLIVSAPLACSEECLYQVDAGVMQTINCEETSVLLEGISLEGGDPVWLDAEGMVISNSFDLTVEESGLYFLEVTFDDDCTTMDSVLVTADVEIPFIQIEQQLADPCSSESYILDASASDLSQDISFEWYDAAGNNISSDDLMLEVEMEGVYYLESFDNSNGCSNIDSIDVLEIVISIGDASANYSAITDSTYQLDVFSDDQIEAITWSSPELLSCANCVNPIATLDASTSFTVEITYANGCTDLLTLYVPIDKREEIFISNIFSPNNDGTNDVFYVQSSVDRLITEFIIYDRWGNRVAYRQNIMTNNPDLGWKGDWNGEDLNPGVYMYYIVVENAQGQEQIFSGDISILR